MSLSEHRQIENEMLFRRENEEVGDALEDLDAIHIENDKPDLVWDDDAQISFKCECSDENCEQRIPLELSAYKDIHKDRSAFIVKPGHQVEAIEEVINKNANYSVVRKDKKIPEPDPGETLNDTPIDNS